MSSKIYIKISLIYIIMVFKLYDYYRLINKYEKSFINSMHEKHRYLAWFRRYDKEDRVKVKTIYKEKCRVLEITLKSNKKNKLNINKGVYMVTFN
jgi:hypothetical protein